MTGTPQTRYAKNGDLHIAYQVVGEGPIDLALLPEWTFPLEGRWEQPAVARSLWRLASFTRLISFDKRGLGCSDPAPFEEASAPEHWMDDLRVVLDEVGCGRTAVFATSDSGAAAILFAATFPERTSALILVNATARLAQADGYSFGFPPHLAMKLRDGLPDEWVTGTGLSAMIPDNRRLREWCLKWRRIQASPNTARAFAHALLTVDVRHVLPVIKVPTLVIHSAEPLLVRPEHGRYLAERIAGARYVELPGRDFWWAEPAGAVVDEIEEFLTGIRPAAQPDRVLATVLFTDIVGSTERAATLGDHRWRDVLDQHDETVRRELERFRGTEVKVSGDGFLATFDGPARAMRCACAITDAAKTLGLEVRAGLHTVRSHRWSRAPASSSTTVGPESSRASPANGGSSPWCARRQGRRLQQARHLLTQRHSVPEGLGLRTAVGPRTVGDDGELVAGVPAPVDVALVDADVPVRLPP